MQVEKSSTKVNKIKFEHSVKASIVQALHKTYANAQPRSKNINKPCGEKWSKADERRHSLYTHEILKIISLREQGIWKIVLFFILRVPKMG